MFSHHVDSTATLSDQLQQSGVDHEIIGLPESVTTALDAQHGMVAFAGGTTSWDQVRARLAVFVTSTERGKNAPELARMIIGTGASELPATLARRLDQLRLELTDSDITAAAHLAGQAHRVLGLPRGERQWRRAARLLRPLVTRSARRATRADGALTLLDLAVSQQRASLLTYATDADPVPVQLMGLYQTKGREADTTVVVLRSNDFYGTERSPFPSGPGCSTSCSPAPGTRPSCSSSAMASRRLSRRWPTWHPPRPSPSRGKREREGERAMSALARRRHWRRNG